MTTLAGAGIAVAAVVAGTLAFRLARTWLRMRGTRLVSCPENHAPVAVEVDMKRLALTSVAGKGEFRLRDCSRWPEKKDCGQMCLAEIEEAPHDCLVREVLRHWFEGKTCAMCGRDISPVHWHDHKPAFKSATDDIVEWSAVPTETMPLFLAGARPVCWNCMIAEGFRHDHPDLVVDRPRPPRAAHHH